MKSAVVFLSKMYNYQAGGIYTIMGKFYSGIQHMDAYHEMLLTGHPYPLLGKQACHSMETAEKQAIYKLH